MKENLEWEIDLEERFTGAMEWVRLNCKDEIIDGVNMNSLGATLKSFISTLLTQERKKWEEEEQISVGAVYGYEAGLVTGRQEERAKVLEEVREKLALFRVGVLQDGETIDLRDGRNAALKEVRSLLSDLTTKE